MEDEVTLCSNWQTPTKIIHNPRFVNEIRTFKYAKESPKGFATCKVDYYTTKTKNKNCSKLEID